MDGEEPQTITAINNYKLIMEMQTKVTQFDPASHLQWFTDAGLEFTNAPIRKPKVVPLALRHTKVNNLMVFEMRSSSNHYWEWAQVKRDLQKLFAWTYVYRVTESV